MWYEVTSLSIIWVNAIEYVYFREASRRFLILSDKILTVSKSRSIIFLDLTALTAVTNAEEFDDLVVKRSNELDNERYSTFLSFNSSIFDCLFVWST
jgi:hypothetical protein